MARTDGVEFVRISQGNAHILQVVADDVFDDEIDTTLLDASFRNGQLLVVATHNGSVVGQIQAMIQRHLDGPPQLYIDNLGVSPMHQRRGIARGLVHEATAWSNEFGCEEAWIVTDLDNDAANALYVALGARQSIVALYSLDQRGSESAQQGLDPV